MIKFGKEENVERILDCQFFFFLFFCLSSFSSLFFPPFSFFLFLFLSSIFFSFSMSSEENLLKLPKGLAPGPIWLQLGTECDRLGKMSLRGTRSAQSMRLGLRGGGG